MTSPEHFTIRRAALAEKSVIDALLQPYEQELSRFPDENPDPQDENGVYLNPYLDLYWREPERFPYLLFSDGRVAGFALVRQAGDHWEIAEFYVEPAFRRRGLGEAAGRWIFKRHPGSWHIMFNKHNDASRNLWRKLARDLDTAAVREGEQDASHDYVSFSL